MAERQERSGEGRQGTGGRRKIGPRCARWEGEGRTCGRKASILLRRWNGKGNAQSETVSNTLQLFDRTQGCRDS